MRLNKNQSMFSCSMLLQHLCWLVGGSRWLHTSLKTWALESMFRRETSASRKHAHPHQPQREQSPMCSRSITPGQPYLHCSRTGVHTMGTKHDITNEISQQQRDLTTSETDWHRLPSGIAAAERHRSGSCCQCPLRTFGACCQPSSVIREAIPVHPCRGDKGCICD